VIPRTRFSPRFLPGLEGWWDASVESSVTLNGTNVSVLADLSGNGRNAAQATASRQPAYTGTRNGLRMMTFNHTAGQFLRGPWELTLTGQATFAVFSATNATTIGRFGRPFSQSTTTDGTPTGPVNNDYAFSGHYIPIIRVSNANQFCSFRTGADRAPVTVTYNQWGVFAARYSSINNNISNSLNGGAENVFGSDALNTTLDTFGIGGGLESDLSTAGGFFGGSIAEVISYSRALSNSEYASVLLYLRSKWGTP